MFRVAVVIDDEWGSVTQNLVQGELVKLERDIAVAQSLTNFITEALGAIRVPCWRRRCRFYEWRVPLFFIDTSTALNGSIILDVFSH